MNKALRQNPNLHAKPMCKLLN